MKDSDRRPRHRPACRLYVGNLPYRTTEPEIARFFESQGYRPVSVRLITDPETGRSKGFAFVDLKEADLASALACFADMPMDGRPLRVELAVDKKRPAPSNTEPPRQAPPTPNRTAPNRMAGRDAIAVEGHSESHQDRRSSFRQRQKRGGKDPFARPWS